MEINEELQRLKILSGQIEKKVKLLEQENTALKNQLLANQTKLSEQEEALEDFKNQIKISKIVRNIPVENKASAELKGRIDDYIKEIDKIITYLSE
jgi:DNA-binding protein H-NS